MASFSHKEKICGSREIDHLFSLSFGFDNSYHQPFEAKKNKKDFAFKRFLKKAFKNFCRL